MESLNSLTPDERTVLAATLAVTLYNTVGKDSVGTLTLLLNAVIGILELMSNEVTIINESGPGTAAAPSSKEDR